MDRKDLANLIFPDAKDISYYEEKYPRRNQKKEQLLQDLPKVLQVMYILEVYTNVQFQEKWQIKQMECFS